MKRRLLVVGCGFPQLGLLRFCHQEGLHVVGLDMNPRAVGRSACDEYVVASTTDVEAIVAAVRAHDLHGLTTCGSAHALWPTAEAARQLGKPFYGAPDTIRRCQSKDQMRGAYAARDVPSPAYRLVEGLAEAQTFAAAQGFPIVVKPVRGWGQRGVAIVKGEGELEEAVAGAIAAARKAGVAEGPVCLLEDFIEGREFSVDAYTRDGVTEVLAVTERIITGYPDPPGITFAEVHPSELGDDELERVKSVARQGLEALGITRGPTYTQMRSGPKGAFIVETAYRLGGGLDPDVTFLASGISLYRRIVGVALDDQAWETTGVEAEAHGGATGRFIIAEPGVVRSVTGLDEARQMPGIESAEVYVQPGATVHPLTDGSKRAGHVLARGRDRAEAESRARAAMATIVIDTEKP